MKCKMCGKEFSPSFGNLAKGYGAFCSKVCYGLYRSSAMKSGEYKCPQPKKVYKFTCLCCGKEFERDGHTAHRNKYCSTECSQKHRVGKNHPRFKNLVDVDLKCIECGKNYTIKPYLAKRKHTWGNFCTMDCKSTWQSKHVVGENHPQWEGGKSFEPYCPLFNKSFKERVRAFYDNTCVLCNTEQNVEKLHVHHVDANKQTCCDDSPKAFVALCRSCHSKVRHYKDVYEPMFHEMIQTKYNGRSYFTMKEWELLNPIATYN